MSEEKVDLKSAKSVYNALCQVLDGYDFSYQKQEDDLRAVIKFGNGNLPIELTIKVHANRRLVLLLSKIPIEVPGVRRAAMAVAVNQANYLIADGDFDYSYKNGEIIFRMTLSYHGCTVGNSMLDYMLSCAVTTIDDFNIKFAEVAKSNMSFNQILEYVKFRK